MKTKKEVFKKLKYEELFEENNKKRLQLLKNLKSNLPQLKKALERASDHWVAEDLFYRFYYGSFKVYRIQQETKEIVDLLRKMNPSGQKELLDPLFESIYSKGCSGRQFKIEDNRNWEKVTKPMVEAFFHARYFLELAIKYGQELDEVPQIMPSGWAALLCLYLVR